MAPDLRLVVPASAAWLVAAIVVGAPSEWLVAWAGVLALCALGVMALLLLVAAGFSRPAWSRRRRRHHGSRRAHERGYGRSGGAPQWVGTVAVAVAAVVVVLASVGAQVGARNPPSVEGLAGHTVTATITVGSAAVESDAVGFTGTQASRRFTATATRIVAGGRENDLRIPVLVFVRSDDSTFAPSAANEEPDDPIQIGAQLRVVGTLKATDPGESVAYLVFATGAPVVASPAPWWLDWANRLRDGFRESVRGLPGDGAELVPGLALGDVSLVSDDLDSSMIDSGLSHLTAVSGANCAVVVAAIMLLGGAIGLSRRWRIVASVLLMVAFVVLVTPSASVVRASVMAAVVLLALGTGRAPRGMPALAFASLVMLTADPWLSHSYGLALSVLATAGLLLLTRPIQQVLAKWMPAGLSLVIAVPLAAQLACQPILVLLAPKISTYSVFSNLLAEPAAPIATVIGLVSCLVGALIPPLAPVGAWLTWVPASWIAGVATFFAHAPGASIPWPGGTAGVALVLTLTALTFAAVFLRESPAYRRRRAADWSSRRRPRLRTRPLRRSRPRSRLRMPDLSATTWLRLTSGAAVALTITIYAGSALGSAVRPSGGWPPGWTIAACDIGQGDAVVVRDPDTGSIGLVDVGPDPALLTTCLHRLNVGVIDLLVLTHYDLDHVGGLSAVVGHVTTAMLGPPDDDHDGGHDSSMASELTAGGAEVEHPTRGDTGTLGDLAYSVLWPEAGTDLRGNDACVTLQFSGAIRSLFLGDLGEDAQKAMMAVNQLPHEDVVKVAHHGSADQSEDLYHAISATVGVISVGMNNRYGHPTDRLLSILGRSQTLAYRTDLLGMIVLTPTDGGIDVWSDGAARVEKKE
ncbi:ComEC/Rec2 family competence protein [Subtercola sp. YIM 133946]|uniref:ComEC/Rec2 family competence protein n=1 Tax=Subtercola sp. YIM 133946 TaxID=3118909 RepID=UPI002F958944